MRMSHEFSAVRAAAQHCPELTAQAHRRGPRPEDRAALIAAWRRDLARRLAADLSPLLADDRLEVSVSEPDQLTGADALQRIGMVAANSLLRVGASAETALLSFDFVTALALTDRSFGGDGRPVDSAPEQLPRSATLMVEEAAAIIAEAITCVSFGDAPPPAGLPVRGANGVGVIVRSESATRLKPFALDAACVMFTLTIANRKGGEWRASLAVAAERMDRLLPGTATRPRPPRTVATGMTAPFAQMPLPLHVVLAEFNLSLARLQTLGPGDTIPLAVGRQVPLLVGDQLIAHGSIGTCEDRMAICLNRFPTPSEPTPPEGVAP